MYWHARSVYVRRRLRAACFATLAAAAGLAAASAARDAVAAPSGESTLKSGSLTRSSMGCERVKLSVRPQWVGSAAWEQGGRTLMVVDPKMNELLHFSETGESVAWLPVQTEDLVKRLFPARVRAQGSNLLLELPDSRLVSLDSSLALTSGPVDLLPKKEIEDVKLLAGTSRVTVAALHAWEPAGGDIVGFADLKTEKGWESAFVRFPLNEPGNVRILEEVQTQNPLRTYFQIGKPFIAALGDDAYILRPQPQEPLQLLRSRKDHPLDPPLAGFKLRLQVPVLPGLHSFGDTKKVMAAFESSPAEPEGLYGWNGALYLVFRSVERQGGAKAWFISKIDPASGAIVGTQQLPLNADHLSVAPGPREWAFIEKGPVNGFGEQWIQKMVLIPSRLFEGRLDGEICGS